ncbi:PilW family protein [Variovorax sp. PCZ-1]|uniref:PilW family protein n=1 Tax=Variovorax sp. PCZ-1 TaxID=2835533 RepID=UPI001BCB8161|nr:PilW family protein [Variovorax sp. PCZ-1]MBS7807513.1 PilW family protein [Variovorax sp. PCZ-1]
MSHRSQVQVRNLRRQAGLTLIELMIGLVLGLLIIAAASATYVSTVQASRVAEANSQMNETAAITLGLLQQQIRLAGYSQIVGSTTYSIRKNFDGSGIRGCTGGFSSASTAAFNSLTCNNTTATPDSLVIRYEATVNNTIPTGANVPTNCVGEGISQSTPSSATSTVPGAMVPGAYRLSENRYFVRTAGTPSGGPELYCAGATGTNTFGTISPVMEGIEAMQITYGVANTSTGTVTSAYMSAQAIDTTFASESLDTRWKRVVSARVCIVIRSTDASERFANVTDTATNQYFDCSNTAQTITDGRARRAYTTTIMLKNKLDQL